jgi:hypothetical protein
LGVSEKVMGMTFSEFGRRIISNASLGTDHGAAAPMFLFGNYVNAGVSGNNPNIPSTANYNDNLEMEYDFRQVYASLFEQWFCVDKNDQYDFLFDNFESLAVTSGAACSPTATHDINKIAGKSILEISPNPIQDYGNIQFFSNGKPVIIQLFDLQGRPLRIIKKGTFQIGIERISVNLSNLPSGHYFITLTGSGTQQTKKLVKI